MSTKQKTIKKECVISGIGLHTGNKANITLKPAKENEGVNFIRIDLVDKPVIKCDLASLAENSGMPRCTSIGKDESTIHTVEHLLSVLCALGIDNLTVEIDNNELPGLDGSGKDFLEKIESTGIVEQEAQKEIFKIIEPIGVEHNGSAIYIVPANDFKISYTLDYDHPYLHSQFFSQIIDEKSFKEDIAPCRTFCLEEEARELRENGLGRGADYTNTLVVGEKGVIDNELRFHNEFARHKVLDFIGDLYLLGMPIKGHVFAMKSGHKLNLELLKRIAKQKKRRDKVGSIPTYDWSEKKEYGIADITKVLPHRYPFLYVDRIIELEKGKKAIGIKNVTTNDHFFQGHFPTRPVMPGVLMVEALAQTAGFVVLTNEAHRGKVALFMSADNIKFRKVVSPGDQLLLEVEVVSDKSRLAKIRAQARVGEDVVAEVDMVFSYTDATFLD